MEIDLNELMWTALRASFVYLFLLLVVRLLGKREIGNTSAFDLVVALILGEVVDEIIYADVTILQGGGCHRCGGDMASGQLVGKLQERGHR